MKTALLLTALLIAPAGARESIHYTLFQETGLPVRAAMSSPHFAVDSAVAPGGGEQTSAHFRLRNGPAGQLVDRAGYVLTSVPAPVPEGASAQLIATAVMDDGTSAPAGAAVWEIVSGPLLGLTETGGVTAGLVAHDTPATVRATVAGEVIGGAVSVRDSIPDNFGPVAGDGLPDDWQYAQFDPDGDGILNAPAGPAEDADSDGATNQMEWMSGTGALNPAERFRFDIAGGKGGELVLRLGPVRRGMRYTVLRRDGLDGPGEKETVVEPEQDAGAVDVRVDPGGHRRAFYQVVVEKN